MPAPLRRSARAAAALLVASLVSSNVFAAPQSGPAPPPFAIASVNGQVIVSWLPVPGAVGYEIEWDLKTWDPSKGPVEQAAAPPLVIPALPGGQAIHVAIASKGPGGAGPASVVQSTVIAPGGAEKFFPAWHDVAPKHVIEIAYDGAKSSAQNGAALKTAMQGLVPGDELRIGSGTWKVDAMLDLSLAGTATAPIRIVAKPGAKPVITRGDAKQNTVNVGVGAQARYLLLRGLDIKGGDIALRVHAAHEVWIDQCHVHDCKQTAIAANSAPVHRLYLTRNEVHGTGGYGEAIYVGGNYGSAIASRCVIAQNHVHDTGGSQGDGIELKQGSWGNTIAENYVHGTKYPCILVYGTGGKPRNVIESNVCIGSGDAVLQVQGEALVRNNVLAKGAVGFLSTDHQGESRNLTFVHNTIVNQATAARLTSWSGRPGMVFANNAAYSQSGDAIHFGGGSSGVTITGNVVHGPVVGAQKGYALGGGLSDFAAVTWDASLLNTLPKKGGALDGAGNGAWMQALDLLGHVRLPGLEAGAVDAP